MPRGFRPHSVPRFTPDQISKANKCAVLLWNGIDFTDGSYMKPGFSDFELLCHFYSLFSGALRNPPRLTLRSQELHDLIIAVRIKAMLRSHNSISRPNCSRYIRHNYATFRHTYNTSTRSEDAVDCASDFLLSCARSFIPLNTPTNAGYRVPLASRLLFFGAPDLLFFNHSNPLVSKGMQFPTRPQDSNQRYSQEMLLGVRRNWTQLSRYNIPLNNNGIPEPRISKIYDTHWWARRILDIALLLKYKVFYATHGYRALYRGTTLNVQLGTTCPCP